jgi:prepilin-type N-terminal cleavage/methylation domain-containing protein
MRKSPTKGFTLIELLVVISIIGLLAGILIAAINSSRSKARDAERIQEITEVRNALEAYKAQNGKYPQTYLPGDTEEANLSGPGAGGMYQCGMCSAYTGTNVIPGLLPKYLAKEPTDAAQPDYVFEYSSDGINYMYDEYDALENSIPTNSPYYRSACDAPATSLILYSDPDYSAINDWCW